MNCRATLGRQRPRVYVLSACLGGICLCGCNPYRLELSWQRPQDLQRIGTLQSIDVAAPLANAMVLDLPVRFVDAIVLTDVQHYKYYLENDSAPVFRAALADVFNISEQSPLAMKVQCTLHYRFRGEAFLGDPYDVTIRVALVISKKGTPLYGNEYSATVERPFFSLLTEWPQGSRFLNVLFSEGMAAVLTQISNDSSIREYLDEV